MAAISSRIKSTGLVRPSSSDFAPSSLSSGIFFSKSQSPTRINPHSHSQLPSSPTRINLYGHSLSTSSSSVRFAKESPSSLISASKPRKMTCMCSPTTHPGSFRCSLHKNNTNNDNNSSQIRPQNKTASFPSNRLNARRSAMTNSLVRIGGVEGELMKRALAALIRPSSHHKQRRADFKPRPSRLSIMSKADEDI